MLMEIPELNKSELRKFGLITGAIVIVLFGLLIPWLFDIAWPRWPFMVGGILAVWAVVIPNTLKPVYVVWMKIGHVLGWINTRIILAILFYGMFLPIGMLMQLFGWDPMYKKLSKGLKTYRIESQESVKEHFERPY